MTIFSTLDNVAPNITYVELAGEVDTTMDVGKLSVVIAVSDNVSGNEKLINGNNYNQG